MKRSLAREDAVSEPSERQEAGRATSMSEAVGRATDDDAVQYLRTMKSLRHINVVGTKITEAAVKELKQALPGLEIQR